MKKLDKEQLARKDDLRDALAQAYTKLDAAISEYNGELELLRNKIERAIGDYNETATEVRDFRDEIAQEIQDYMDERSDAWREGDKGGAYSEWQTQWGNIDLEDLEFELPEDLEAPSVPEDIFEGVEDDVSEVMM